MIIIPVSPTEAEEGAQELHERAEAFAKWCDNQASCVAHVQARKQRFGWLLIDPQTRLVTTAEEMALPS